LEISIGLPGKFGRVQSNYLKKGRSF